jgi:hypothetical protein
MKRPARALREALVGGEPVSDAAFDALFPEELRARSAIHWTPVAIARRVAELIAPAPGARIADVGAGVGKVCLIGALVTDAIWWGFEQDAVQVAAANRAAWALGIEDRTRFVHGDGSRLAWDELDAVYFYNPFTTLMLAGHESPFVRYAMIQRTLRRVEQRLATTRVGAKLVTYHGWGGVVPPSYARLRREPAGEDALELWQRDRVAAESTP